MSTVDIAHLEQVLQRLSRGKVRDSFRVLNHVGGPQTRLVVTSNRVSIFDFVLPFDIPDKGAILNATNIFNRLLLRKALMGFRDDLMKYGKDIDALLPVQVRGNRALWKVATVVEELDMVEYEIIIRALLTGTGFKAYKETGEVCGHKLSTGLLNGSRIPQGPICTPSTKAHVGHDEHVTYQSMVEECGEKLPHLFQEAYTVLAEHARSVGFILVDTKGEAGVSRRAFGSKKTYVLADEWGTPDSSRFWRVNDYAKVFPHSLPQSFDKQIVREWGLTQGIDKLDPQKPEDVAFVASLKAPQDVIAETSRQYHKFFQLWTNMTLPQFEREVLKIPPSI